MYLLYFISETLARSLCVKVQLQSEVGRSVASQFYTPICIFFSSPDKNPHLLKNLCAFAGQ